MTSLVILSSTNADAFGVLVYWPLMTSERQSTSEIIPTSFPEWSKTGAPDILFEASVARTLSIVSSGLKVMRLVVIWSLTLIGWDWWRGSASRTP